VRWPARPAELRAGLDFSFVSFLCIKTKKRKEEKVITFMHFLLLLQKKVPNLPVGRPVLIFFFPVLTRQHHVLKKTDKILYPIKASGKFAQRN